MSSVQRADYAQPFIAALREKSRTHQEYVTMADQFVTDLALKECHLPRISPPAVLIGITGQGRTRGMATTLMFEATINQHIAYVQPDPTLVSAGWVRRIVDANYKLLRDESDAGGSTKGAITCEQIATMRCPVPPLAEQLAITAFLDAETARLDALTTAAESAIALLRERRAALISAAVTGQVDVRHLARSESA